MTLREVAEFLIWFPPMINIFAISSQVVLSERLRSVQGVSTYMLILRYVGASAQVLYLNFLCLPFGYRVMIIPQWLLLGFMFFQHIKYARKKGAAYYMVASWVAILAAWGVALMYGLKHPSFVGNMSGWLMVVLGTITQLPQIVRNWQRKSVRGYSKNYVVFSICAYTIDVVLSIILGVPMQTYITYGRAVTYRVIELFQFSWYEKRSQA